MRATPSGLRRINFYADQEVGKKLTICLVIVQITRMVPAVWDSLHGWSLTIF